MVFKVGDIVECVQQTLKCDLGKRYVITSISPDGQYLRHSNDSYGCNYRHFVLVKSGFSSNIADFPEKTDIFHEKNENSIDFFGITKDIVGG